MSSGALAGSSDERSSGGTIHSEETHPISRILIKLYAPVCELALRWKWFVIAGAVAVSS